MIRSTSTARFARRPPRQQFGRGDIGILNYVLTLEYLENEFYKEAKRNNKNNQFITGKATKDFLDAVVRDEKAHVGILKGILGRKAIKKPKFDFRDTTSNEDAFIKTSFALENTGVGAYSGQAFNIKDPDVLAGALSIVTIEARLRPDRPDPQGSARHRARRPDRRGGRRSQDPAEGQEDGLHQGLTPSKNLMKTRREARDGRPLRVGDPVARKVRTPR